jgi:DNA-binding transcriptional LysR family regulator
MSSVSLDLFAAFAKVAELQGFSGAARALGVSKATVSKQVAELEARLGVALLHRTTRRLSLTEAGGRVLARAQRMVEEAEAAAEEAAETRTSLRGRVRVAAPLSFAVRYLAPVLPAFLAAHPEVQLELSLDDRRIDLIAEGFDLAIRISQMPDSSLRARPLAPVRLSVVASPAYWAAHGRPQRPEELSLHPCFRYANLPTGVFWTFEGPDGQSARVAVDGPLCINNGDAELPSLRAGIGVALLPDFIIWEDVKAGALEAVLSDWRSPEPTLHILSPPGRAQPRRVRAFADFVIAQFGGGRAPWQTDEA